MTNDLNFRSYAEVTAEEVESLIRDRGKKERGEDVLVQLPTGLRDLDRNGGLELDVSTVIAGPTGEGKSALKLHLIRSIASAGHEVVVLDFEDPTRKTVHRSLAESTGIGSHKIGRLAFEMEDEKRLRAACASIGEWGSRVRHHAGLVTADQVRETCKRYPNARALFVDYAQALPGRNGNLEREIADISWDLGEDAQRNHRSNVIFSQTIAAIEERGARRFERDGTIEGYRPGPGKSYIAWARALGERAKAVWYLFRPGRWAKKHGIAGATDNIMEIIVDKSNFSMEGTVRVSWDGARAALSDLPERKR